MVQARSSRIGHLLVTTKTEPTLNNEHCIKLKLSDPIAPREFVPFSAPLAKFFHLLAVAFWILSTPLFRPLSSNLFTSIASFNLRAT